MILIASDVEGRLMAVNRRPTALLSEDPWIALPDDGHELVALDDVLVGRRSSLLAKSADLQAPKADGAEELEAKLETAEDSMLVAQAELSQLRTDARREQEELGKLRERRDFINADVRRNRDIKRLRDYGGRSGLTLVEDICPTCSQSIQDSLIPTNSAVMGVEDNIRLLSSESQAVGLLINAAKGRLLSLKGRRDIRASTVSKLRKQIRDLRSDLMGNEGLSVAALREQIYLQEEVARMEHSRDELERETERLRALAAKWHDNRARRSELPDNYFSEKDNEKLVTVTSQFARNLTNFGYRSTGVSMVNISNDNYRPIYDDFEIAFAASASDNIRLIWAYTLALLQVSSMHGGNHWGILMFDEPEQQQMRGASSDALYSEIAGMAV